MYTYLWLWTTKLNLRIEVRFGWKHYSCQLMISLSGLCSFTSAYFWYPLAIYANQQKSITVMITSEGCWVFVMRETWLVLKQWVVGSYTRPTLPSTGSFRFVGFAKVLILTRITAHRLLFVQAGNILVFSRNCLFRIASPSVPPEQMMICWLDILNILWHGGMVAQHSRRIWRFP